MWTTEIEIFLITTALAFLLLVIGIVTSIFHTRHRHLLNIAERDRILQQHKFDLMSAQLNTQRETAENIGMEIHDSVTQKITLASIYLQKIQYDIQEKEEVNKIININNILTNALMELRSLSKDLTENLFINNSLESMIQNECDNINKSGICYAHFSNVPIPDIFIKVKISILRVIQEFLQNSIKHSECTNIHISITNDKNILTLTLHDDGKGFDLEKQQFTGIGLESIRRRIEIINAKSILKSKFNQGTTLKNFIPLNSISV